MTEIRDFKRIRVGSNWPRVIDVSPISTHEAYGIFGTASTYRAKGEDGYVQFRVHNSDHEAALFVFGFSDQQVPEHWKDSTVIWDSRAVEE